MSKELATAYALGAIGAVQGVYKYAIRPEITAERAWIGLGVLITAYELTAPQGHLLSEGVDRSLEKHPVLTTLAIGTVALHLCNVLPKAIDPLHQGLNLIRGHDGTRT